MHREFLPGRKIFRCARNPLLLVQSIAQDLSLKRDDNFVFSCGCAALRLTWRSRNQRFPFRHSPVISTVGRDLMHREFLPGRKIFRCARNPLLLVQSIAQDLSLKRDDNFVFSCGYAALCLTWRSRNQRFPFRHSPVISTAGRDLMHREFLPGRKIFRCARNPLLLVQSIAQDLSLKRDDNFVFSCGCAALCLTWRSRNQRFPFVTPLSPRPQGEILWVWDSYQGTRFLAQGRIGICCDI
uniref:Uncharacterized protein n=1 Tax=Candidatus Kentrum sp. TUN TaxID=2126343 RepID=A0A450ZZU7_9GAMM|nr:MAG: hypothetical protein BECKTUN1418E_GA0071001_10535 [Candidatus Kentron sp. TUN]